MVISLFSEKSFKKNFLGANIIECFGNFKEFSEASIE